MASLKQSLADGTECPHCGSSVGLTKSRPTRRSGSATDCGSAATAASNLPSRSALCLNTSHRVREAMRELHFADQLGGEGKVVEAAGKERNKHRSKHNADHIGGSASERPSKRKKTQHRNSWSWCASPTQTKAKPLSLRRSGRSLRLGPRKKSWETSGKLCSEGEARMPYVTLRVVDADGNPVPNVTLTFDPQTVEDPVGIDEVTDDDGCTTGHYRERCEGHIIEAFVGGRSVGTYRCVATAASSASFACSNSRSLPGAG